MRVTLRGRFFFPIVMLVTLAVAASAAGLLLNAVSMTVREAKGRGELVGQQVFYLSRKALKQGTARTAEEALAKDPGVRGLLDSAVGYSESIIYVMLVDTGGRALVHSEPRKEGQVFAPRPGLTDLAQRSPLSQLIALYRGPRSYEVSLPVEAGGEPFGQVRVGLSTRLIEEKLSPMISLSAAVIGASLLVSVLVAMRLGSMAVRPFRLLAEGLERWQRGEFAHPVDLGQDGELKELSSALSSLGEALAARAIPFERVMDGLAEAIVVLNKDKRVLLFNRAMEEVLGLSLSEGVGRGIGEMGPGIAPLSQVVEDAFGSGSSLRGSQVTLTTPGGEQDYIVSVDLIKERDTATGALVTLKNLGPLMEVKEQFEFSHRLAAINRLSAGLAHEVRNPLNSMVIHLELLKSKLSRPQEAAKHLEVIATEIRRLDRVVDGFLAYSRPQELRPELLDLNGLIQETVALVVPEAEREGVKFQLKLDANQPLVTGDRGLLKQALLNLIANGREAMPGGGTIQIASEMGTEGRATFRVSDEGHGIPEEQIGVVFDLYYTTKREGNGIGLALVYRIVQMHDGQVSLSSRVGEGTSVSITLPVGWGRAA